MNWRLTEDYQGSNNEDHRPQKGENDPASETLAASCEPAGEVDARVDIQIRVMGGVRTKEKRTVSRFLECLACQSCMPVLAMDFVMCGPGLGLSGLGLP